MNRQYSTAIDKAITYIKQLKNSNDLLNKAIGVQSSIVLAKRLKVQQPLIQQNMNKTQQLIQKLQKSYLDPDTARKIGTIKQQFRIQRDRRKQLVTTNDIQSNHQKQSRYNQSGSNVQLSQTQRHEGWNKYINKQSQSTRTQPGSIQMQRQDHHFDTQIQSKILRQKNKQIQQISTRLMDVHNIMNQTSLQVYEQGQKLDIIGDQIFQSYRNIRDARQNLVEANQSQKKAKRKYVYFTLSILLLVGAIVSFFVFI